MRANPSKEKKINSILIILGILLITSGISLFAFNSGESPETLGHSGEEIQVNVDGTSKDLNTALRDLDDLLNSIETDAINKLENCESDLSSCETDLTNTENSLSTCQSDLSDCESDLASCGDCDGCECSWSGWSHSSYPDFYGCYKLACTPSCSYRCCDSVAIAQKCEGGCIVDKKVVCTSDRTIS